MKRITHRTKSVDENGSDKDGYTTRDADASPSIESSFLTAEDLNMWQEELCNLAQINGTPLDASSMTQCSDAIIAKMAQQTAAFNSFAQSEIGKTHGIYMLNAFEVSNPTTSSITCVSCEKDNSSVSYQDRFIATSGESPGKLYYSTDGLTWSSISTTQTTWVSCCFGGGQTLVAASSGSNQICRILAGATTVTPTASSPASGWAGICYAPDKNRFVVVASSGTTRLITSNNVMSSWTSVSVPASQWFRVAYSQPLSLFAAISGDLTSSNNLLTSSDGINWTTRTIPGFKLQTGITWCDFLGLFIVTSVAGSPSVCTSPDGINWTSRLTSATLNGVYSCEELKMVIFLDTDYIWYSFDCITFTKINSARGNLVYGDYSKKLNRLVMASNSGTNRIISTRRS